MSRRWPARLACLAAALLGAPALAAGPALPATDAKVRTAQRVLDDIVHAIGDGRTPPSLRLVPRTSRSGVQVAWFSPDEHAVVIEERAYDTCAAQGADSLSALAVLLGHELAHCYRDHDWPGDFGNGFADLPVGEQVRAAARERAGVFETEADLFGGFYGYLAGYNTLGVAPELLPRIYAAFELSGDIPGYPALADRQDIARRSEAALRERVPIFEAAHHLLVIGQYEAAAAAFDVLARDFPSREILANAGVALTLEALAVWPPEGLAFALPLELDAHTRLRQAAAGRRGAAGDPARARELLAGARLRFEQAHQRDPHYAPALVDLACLDLLEGHRDEAHIDAEKALALALATGDSGAVGDALLARGIGHAVAAAAGPARADFKRAAAARPTLAGLNLGLLDGAAPPGPEGERLPQVREVPVGPGSETYEAIVGQPLSIELAGVSLDGGTPLLLYRDLGDRHGYVLETGASAIAIVATAPGYDGRTGRGLERGQPAAEVRRLYGAPARVVGGRDGAFLVYEKARIAVALDGRERVRGWLLYHVDERIEVGPDAPEPAARRPDLGPRVALVIGNDGYGEAPLHNAVNDAVAMGQALRQAGFEPVIKEFNADRRAMAEAIRLFGEELSRRGGVGLFYYAGHGVQVDGVNYLVPVGRDIARTDEVPDECIGVDRVLGKMKSAGNGANIVLLDACRSNPYAGTRSGGGGLAPPDHLEGTYLAYATAPGQVAADAGDGEHSAFTGALLAHLLEPGQSIDDLFTAVRNDVRARTDGAQSPHSVTALTAKFYFVPPGVEVDRGFAASRSEATAAVGGTTPVSSQAEGDRVAMAAPEPAKVSAATVPLAPASPAADHSGMVSVSDFGFWIDRFEVTNAQFAEFLNARGNLMEDSAPWVEVGDADSHINSDGERFRAHPGYESHPVVEVTWYGARSYCQWRGKRLPAATQWRQAATGSAPRRYPWGDEPLSASGARLANFRPEAAGDRHTAPVGSYPAGASPCGAQDMAGNVWEWVDEADGTDRLALGGSWFNDPDWFGRQQWLDGTQPNEFTGFRCASAP